MSEMVITISIIGALAAIAVPGMTGIFSGSQDAIANEKLEMLNQGLNAYGHAYKEYNAPANDGSASDELTAVLDLEYRNPNPNKTLTGSPFIRPDYRPVSSGSATDYRIVWTGYRFKLLKPGVAGIGLKVVFDGSDYTEPYAYPPNYSSSGR